jgi:hypothetical protein
VLRLRLPAPSPNARAPSCAADFDFQVSVFSVRESLYLIPKTKMLATDCRMFPEYKYSPLAHVNKFGKEEMIKTAVLIASKPEVSGPNKLSWDVVDRSGKSPH